MTTTENNAVWFITGCSTGFGQELASQLLEQGYRVAATARKVDSLSALSEKYGDKVLALPLDVTNQSQIDAAITATVEKFGTLDVLVNNAGYGYFSSVEEGEDAPIRAMFETNVFGLMAVTRSALPVMRKQKSGCIVNLSSIAGIIGRPSSGYYSATKHAVEGLTDALAKEVEPLNIKVMLVNPGPFRTDFAGRSLQKTDCTITDYASTVGKRFEAMSTLSGTQKGDPVRAVAAIIDVVKSGKLPLHLMLGQQALDEARAKLKSFGAEMDAYEATGLATDYPADEAAA